MGWWKMVIVPRAHYSTFRKLGKEGWAWGKLSMHLLVPAVAAGLLLAYDFRLTGMRVGILITSMSIFSALLFNLLMLVYSIVRQPDAEPVVRREPEASAPEGLAPTAEQEFQNLRRRFLRTIFANLSFDVWVSLLVVVVLITWLLLEDRLPMLLDLTFHALAYYGIGVFLVTFFEVLYQVHLLLSKEFDHMKPAPSRGGGNQDAR